MGVVRGSTFVRSGTTGVVLPKERVRGGRCGASGLGEAEVDAM